MNQRFKRMTNPRLAFCRVFLRFSTRSFSLFALVLFISFCLGCQKQTSPTPKLYQRETLEVSKPEKKEDEISSKPYPWSSNRQGMENLPERILKTQSRISNEIEVLERAVKTR